MLCLLASLILQRAPLLPHPLSLHLPVFGTAQALPIASRHHQLSSSCHSQKLFRDSEVSERADSGRFRQMTNADMTDPKVLGMAAKLNERFLLNRPDKSWSLLKATLPSSRDPDGAACVRDSNIFATTGDVKSRAETCTSVLVCD